MLGTEPSQPPNAPSAAVCPAEHRPLTDNGLGAHPWHVRREMLHVSTGKSRWILVAAASGRVTHADHPWDNCARVRRYRDVFGCVPGVAGPTFFMALLARVSRGAQSQPGMAGDVQERTRDGCGREEAMPGIARLGPVLAPPSFTIQKCPQI